MAPHARPAAAGFTLLEVMIAMAVLAIGISSLFGAMGMADQVGERARFRDMAVNAMQKQIDTDRATSWASMKVAPSDPTFAVSGLQPVSGRADVGLRQWINTAGSQRTITYSCQWVDRSGPATVTIDVIIPEVAP